MTQIEQLYAKLDAAKTADEKLALLLDMWEAYQQLKTKPQDRLTWVEQSEQLLPTLPHTIERTELMHHLGQCKLSLNQEAEAAALLGDAISVWRDENNIERFVDASGTLIFLYTNSGHYEKAISLGLETLPLLPELDDPLAEVRVRNSIGLAYREYGQDETGLEYLEQALAFAIKADHKPYMANLYNNIAIAYMESDRLDEALAYYLKCLDTRMSEDESYSENAVFGILTNIGILHNYKQDYEKALTYFEKAQDLDPVKVSRNYRSTMHANLGETYLALKDPKRAEKMLTRALELAREEESRALEVAALSHLSTFYKETGDYQRAYEYQVQYTELRKQMFDADRTKSIAEFESQQKEREAEIYRQKNEELKEKNQALAEAHTEIERLNEQLKSDNLRMCAELDITRQLQQIILPRPEELELIEHLDIAGFMEPATEVGGDYYDILSDGQSVKISIGDVTGHGLESGVVMLMTQTAVRTLINAGINSDSVQFFSILNRTIFNNIQRMQVDKSLSMSMLSYQPGKISLAGQHEEALIVRRGGLVERVDTIDLGFPIGLTDSINDYVNDTHFTLATGDGVVLFTDGFTEAENMANDMYGIDRLCAVISKNWDKMAQEIAYAIRDDVHDFIGEQVVHDDLTLVIVKQL